MTENRILIKPIGELIGKGYEFNIPSYQRGYRWTKQQVEDLLKDINEFSPQLDTWYCLQPIVIKKLTSKTTNFKVSLIREIENLDEESTINKVKELINHIESSKKWEVIDGQQRLTTIYLILRCLTGINSYNLIYETRDELQFFLHNFKKIDNPKIDAFYAASAYNTIEKWFENKDDDFKYKFKSKFLESTKVIWYEISVNDNSIDIFTRLNSGKIPLTNAELIKALFLNSSNFKKEIDFEKIRLKQLEIASEWDRIENALQDDSFWYFINKGENDLETRIEFIFNLRYKLNENKYSTEIIGNDDYSTFRFYNEELNNNQESDLKSIWLDIKQCFQTLEELFNDREFYHKAGYLITIGRDIKIILENKQKKTKYEFSKWLDEQISQKVSKKEIDNLEYGKDNGDIINILFLHNIITTLNGDDTSLRFPFNKYKNKKSGGWSLEHIHAQNSDDITKIDDFEEWLKIIDKDILTDNLKVEIDHFNIDKQQEKIPLLVEKITRLFGESNIHSIENMALLSKNDNSKLNNGLFPVKRERIIELEKSGAFIPISTKKVFQKYYKGCTKQLSKWEESDRNSYLKDIKETLENYLVKKISEK
jgi:uncharacterized protein with ParB-like and HNH nuclease domain